MKIVVIGGSGLIGTQLVNDLKKLGHQVTAASLSSGVNTITGTGLAEAIQGAEIVVDVSNSPSYDDDDVMEFFTTSTRNILAAERLAGIKHHVLLSILGVDKQNINGYFRAKFAQENLVRDSGVIYTILRSAQFFQFIGGIVQANVHEEEVQVSSAFIQPVDSADVAAALAELSTGTPLNGVSEIAGPERFRLDELARKYFDLKGDPRRVVTNLSAPYFGAILNDESLIPGDHARLTSHNFNDWIIQPGNLR